MATIVYLEADDEITSAATRIRQAADARVAIVIPFGSRVATSRINFKLLAREAMANGRRLDVVAPDASARALAASAGLPVFASVGEYEDALDAPPSPDADPPAGRDGTALAGAARAGAAIMGVAAVTGSARDAGPGSAGARATTDRRDAAARDAGLDAVIHRGREVPVVQPRRRRPGRGVLVGLLVLVLALGAAGAAAVLVLPSAEIAITPRIEPVGPIELTVVADPAATAIDEGALVIPAQVVEIPVEVSGEFAATGKRVEKTPATGGVRWRNCDPSAAYTIPSGTVVRTPAGVEFRIDESVFLPVAQITGTGAVQTIRCQTSEVSVTAARDGPDGNVAAGTITVIPARYDRNLISVTNPVATRGGAREEFVRISQDDVDAALAQLGEDLAARFQADLEDPAGVPAGATVFPETAVLGEAAPTGDPAALVGQEVAAFTLGLAARGSVLAVDARPVEAIALAALEGAVSPGHALVEGSTRVAVGEGMVRGAVVVFPVAGVARQVRPVDGEALRRQVLGLPEADALALLEPYGEVDLVLAPGFVTTVPALEQRVTLVVHEAVDGTPPEDPVPATPGPGEPPAGDSSDGADPSQPLPSG